VKRETGRMAWLDDRGGRLKVGVRPETRRSFCFNGKHISFILIYHVRSVHRM
jgi:hypothetical protein